MAVTGSARLSGISAMDSTTTAGGRSLLLAASQTEDAVTVFSVASNGRVSAVDSFVFADHLPVEQPTVLRIVEMGADRFVVMGAYGTGSLTVLSLSETGALTFVDQVNDTRDTRFDGISALDHMTVGGMELVVVGGSDGGSTCSWSCRRGACCYAKPSRIVSIQPWTVSTRFQLEVG